MPIDRYYLNSPLDAQNTVQIQGTELHHMQVTRIRVGEQVELINGQGTLAVAELSTLNKKEAWLSILQVSHAPKPGRNIILAQATPRINRLDFIVEKATELGMTELWLFPGELSERKSLSENQLERLQAQLISALKQCGRLWLPAFIQKPPLSQWSKLDCMCLYGDVNPAAPPLSHLYSGGADVLFAVGPESGFTEREEAILRQLNFQGVKLNEAILRTDTAAIIAVGLLAQTP